MIMNNLFIMDKRPWTSVPTKMKNFTEIKTRTPSNLDHPLKTVTKTSINKIYSNIKNIIYKLHQNRKTGF